MLKPGSRHGLTSLISSHDATNFARVQHSQAYDLVNRALDLVNCVDNLVNRAYDSVNHVYDLL